VRGDLGVLVLAVSLLLLTIGLPAEPPLGRRLAAAGTATLWAVFGLVYSHVWWGWA